MICGKNKETYNDLVHWRATHPEFGCHIEGYSEIVHLFMQASDVIVTRGGTTTCAKALHFQCPIIFNAFGGIMPQEELTWKFFRNGFSGSAARGFSDMPPALMSPSRSVAILPPHPAQAQHEHVAKGMNI